MLDFILGLYLAGLAVRGWLRGFVKELLDLAGLVLGVLLGFRLSEPVGDFFVDRFDVTPEWARIGAGIAIFVAIGTIVSIFAHYLGRFVQLPGLNLSNRLLGSGFAVTWGVFLILVFVSIISLLPVPESVDQAIEESTVASAVAGEDSYARELFESAAGDDVISSLLALEPLIGSQRVILENDESAAIPPVSCRRARGCARQGRGDPRLPEPVQGHCRRRSARPVPGTGGRCAGPCTRHVFNRLRVPCLANHGTGRRSSEGCRPPAHRGRREPGACSIDACGS